MEKLDVLEGDVVREVASNYAVIEVVSLGDRGAGARHIR